MFLSCNCFLAMERQHSDKPTFNCLFLFLTASYCMKSSVLSVSSVFLFHAFHYSLDIGIRHWSEICGSAPTFQLIAICVPNLPPPKRETNNSTLYLMHNFLFKEKQKTKPLPKISRNLLMFSNLTFCKAFIS